MNNTPDNNHDHNEDHHAAMAKKNARLGLTVLAIVVGMIGLSFASVPLYDVFCRVTGFAGTPQVSDQTPGTILERKIAIHFNADIDPAMPWIFKPEQKEVTVNIGQRGLTAFLAKNQSNRPTAGTALYNVTPLKAGKYFNKVQCFCFDEQILQPGEEVSMPVMFYIDPEMDNDPNMNDVTTITLSYTFYTAESEELDKALEGFYNDEN